MTLGNRIRKLRTQRKLSQEYLAEQLEVSRQAVSKWENDVSCPDTQKLIRLAELFRVSVEYLATGDTEDSPQADRRPSAALKRISLCFFLMALIAHCIGLFTGEFTRNLIPVFPYLWYGTSTWAIILNVFTALFSVGWIACLAAALSFDRRDGRK